MIKTLASNKFGTIHFLKTGHLAKLTLSLGLFAVSLVYAQSELLRSSPLPPQVVSSKLTIDQAIHRVFVSHPVPEMSSDLKGYLVFDPDLTEVQARATEEFLAAKGKGKKVLLNVRYGMGSERFTNLMIQAAKQGVAVSLVTDANQIFTGDLPEGVHHSSDFHALEKSGSYRQNDMAQRWQEFRKAGFDTTTKFEGDLLSSGTGLLFSHPIYREDMEMKPLMHGKVLFLLNLGDKGEVLDGSSAWVSTQNMNQASRYNSMEEVLDLKVVQALLDRTINSMKTFAKGGEVKEIPDLPPTKVEFKDGFLLVGTTDGRFDLNQWLIQEYDAIHADPTGEVIRHVASDFVFSHRDLVKRIATEMKANLNMNFLGIVDDRFGGTVGASGMPTLAGYPTIYEDRVRPPYFIPNAEDRVRITLYQRPAVDDRGELILEKSEDGPPIGRWVYHDKTDWIESKFGGARYNYIFTGSLNRSSSGHRNFEYVLAGRFPAETKFARATAERVERVLANPNEAQWMVPLDVAQARNVIGGLVGKTDLEIPIPFAQDMIRVALERDFAGFIKMLKEAKKLPTNLANPPSVEEVDQRIAKLANFLDWYAKNIPVSNSGRIYKLRRLTGVAMIVSLPQMSPRAATFLMEGIVWRKELTEEQITALTREALKVLDIDAVVPNEKAKKEVLEKEVTSAPPVGKVTGKVILFSKIRRQELQIPYEIYLKVKGIIGVANSKDPNRIYTEDRKTYDLTEYVIDRDPSSGSFRNVHTEHFGPQYSPIKSSPCFLLAG